MGSSSSPPSPELPVCSLVSPAASSRGPFAACALMSSSSSRRQRGRISGHATCTSDFSEAQPRGAEEARIPCPGAPQPAHSHRGRSPLSLRAHLTGAAATWAVCLWQVPPSASCPTATGSLFLLRGSCQAQHQHQSKVFL